MQVIAKPHARVTLRSDLHRLRLSERRDLWYAGGGATNDEAFGFSGLPSGSGRELARLVDLAITVQLPWKLTAYAYYGRALGGEVGGEHLRRP